MKLLGDAGLLLSPDEARLIESAFQRPVQMAAQLGLKGLTLLLPCGCAWRVTDIGAAPGDFSIEHLALCDESVIEARPPAAELRN